MGQWGDWGTGAIRAWSRGRGRGRRTLLLGELEELVGRVDAGGKHEDERRGGHGVGEHGVEVEHGRLGELLAEVVDDEGRSGEDDPVGAKAAHDDHALQLGAPVLPFAGEARSRGLRLGMAVPWVRVRIRVRVRGWG